jgi:hypothetical protein
MWPPLSRGLRPCAPRRRLGARRLPAPRRARRGRPDRASSGARRSPTPRARPVGGGPASTASSAFWPPTIHLTTRQYLGLRAIADDTHVYRTSSNERLRSSPPRRPLGRASGSSGRRDRFVRAFAGRCDSRAGLVCRFPRSSETQVSDPPRARLLVGQCERLRTTADTLAHRAQSGSHRCAGVTAPARVPSE